MSMKTVTVQRSGGDAIVRVQKAQAHLELKFGRPATLAELGAEVEMPEHKLVEALRFRAEPLSLSTPLGEDGGAELGDVIEDRSADSLFEAAAASMLPEEIGRLLSPLDEREREILRLRFGLDRGKPRTLEEVGKHFNVTRERIRQLEHIALTKMRKAMHRNESIRSAGEIEQEERTRQRMDVIREFIEAKSHKSRL